MARYVVDWRTLAVMAMGLTPVLLRCRLVTPKVCCVQVTLTVLPQFWAWPFPKRDDPVACHQVRCPRKLVAQPNSDQQAVVAISGSGTPQQAGLALCISDLRASGPGRPN
jgi:hypothetical protein